MKIQCNVCGVAEATVLCCADEAALCSDCDEKVHAANKLASKHQRVPLSGTSSQMPKCDICQETAGYFFCLEDRALLCRRCDVAIHSANNYVCAHQRFLLTGVKVGLQAVEPASSSLSGRSQSAEKALQPDLHSFLKKNSPASSDSQNNKQLPTQVGGMADFVSERTNFAGGSGAGSIPQWQFDEFLGLSDSHQFYDYMDNGSSKADAGKIGDAGCSPILRTAEGELDGDDYLGQVPDASWAVPEIPSPPTASGLYWPKASQHPVQDAVFVPDISGSPNRNLCHYQPQGPNVKRRRQL